MIERYTRKEMGEMWSLENRFRAWLEVELAVCEAWHRLGIIPGKDMENIRSRADFDLERILEIEEQTKHDVIAFLTAVEEKVGPSSRYIHLGCTSSDIVDTSNALLLFRAGTMISRGLDDLLQTLAGLAAKFKGRLMMGRTHGIHAEPTSFGLKMTGFYAEFQRHRQRWQRALENIRIGKISGAVGTYAHLEPEVERITCQILGLEPDPVSTQIIQRDRYAEYFTSLAIMAGGIERICVELRHLQRTEVLEVEEGFSKGQKGSSAMPHKKNPISAENLTGLSRLVRTNSLAAMENMALWHERDISHSSVERVIMPDSTILIHYMLSRLNSVLANLRVNDQNMDRNLNLSMGLFFSQRVLLGLIEKGMQRQKAYELVQKEAMYCWENRTQFPERIRQNAQISEFFSPEELEKLFDSGYYLKHEELIMTRVLG
ncbi:adenylosuccinate lyase [Desulfonatronovibrio hydrogenovorans]|uniref:adenylosuccinate lyase n=1 Tax=Desulfonatronovibrio hydrogenovorans TaxID=53245 RepID=UPI00048D5FA7|nr:adenylosuccinate lyase [Desulfonatronovibrio hydrogenovorans]